ncbi:hypothetical protein HDU98_001210 [Podochytrium sp. JEL0797]|nr:hypothetical protein HDU98_001210 [Podochytrium sp. JEL0797]
MLDRGLFTQTALPRISAHRNYSSFVRQLNKYRFKKRKGTERTSLAEDAQCPEFSHTHFVRGGAALLHHVCRLPLAPRSAAPNPRRDSSSDTNTRRSREPIHPTMHPLQIPYLYPPYPYSHEETSFTSQLMSNTPVDMSANASSAVSPVFPHDSFALPSLAEFQNQFRFSPRTRTNSAHQNLEFTYSTAAISSLPSTTSPPSPYSTFLSSHRTNPSPTLTVPPTPTTPLEHELAQLKRMHSQLYPTPSPSYTFSGPSRSSSNSSSTGGGVGLLYQSIQPANSLSYIQALLAQIAQLSGVQNMTEEHMECFWGRTEALRADVEALRGVVDARAGELERLAKRMEESLRVEDGVRGIGTGSVGVKQESEMVVCEIVKVEVKEESGEEVKKEGGEKVKKEGGEEVKKEGGEEMVEASETTRVSAGVQQSVGGGWVGLASSQGPDNYAYEETVAGTDTEDFDGEESETPIEEPIPTDIFPRRRALIVDDDAIYRRIICAYLTRLNFVCETAATGSEAVEKTMALARRNGTLQNAASPTMSEQALHPRGASVTPPPLHPNDAIERCNTPALTNYPVREMTPATPRMRCVGDASSQDQYHLIVMDIMLPSMNGLQATRQIKARCPEIVVIALTCVSVHAADQDTYLDVGVSGILTKPVGFEELSELVQDAMGRRGRRAVGGGLGDEE